MFSALWTLLRADDLEQKAADRAAFGQVGSEPAAMECCVYAHTLLLSEELCHVALPKGNGFGANSLGLVLGLKKWVMICAPSRSYW